MVGQEQEPGEQVHPETPDTQVEEAARELMEAIAQEPVSPRLRDLAQELAVALDQHLSQLAQATKRKDS